jgi:hypothetical protein
VIKKPKLLSLLVGAGLVVGSSNFLVEPAQAGPVMPPFRGRPTRVAPKPSQPLAGAQAGNNTGFGPNNNRNFYANPPTINRSTDP